MERRLTRAQAANAASIQEAIDSVARYGGRVVLPRLDLELDRALQLRSGVQLCGQGAETILRKGPTRVYPLSGYHNYGMCDVPLKTSAGLEAGMTVSVHDGRTHGGFYETFATVTWVEEAWVGLDHGLEADYSADHHPRLTTAYPLICGHWIHDAAVRDLVLEGRKDAGVPAMGGCRGGAVYFANSRDLEIAGVRERNYHGEGLSLQMCRDVWIHDSDFDENSGNGLHPGAGSTNLLFERCEGGRNERAGFFFCVRANHITVRECRLRANAVGMSVGTRDSHNLVEACTMEDNRGPGILVRETPPGTEAHSCRIRHCVVGGNVVEGEEGQVEIIGPAHDLILDRNRIRAMGHGSCVRVDPRARRIFLEGNRTQSCAPDVPASDQALTDLQPDIECGFGDWPAQRFRHLPTV